MNAQRFTAHPCWPHHTCMQPTLLLYPATPVCPLAWMPLPLSRVSVRLLRAAPTRRTSSARRLLPACDDRVSWSDCHLLPFTISVCIAFITCASRNRPILIAEHVWIPRTGPLRLPTPPRQPIRLRLRIACPATSSRLRSSPRRIRRPSSSSTVWRPSALWRPSSTSGLRWSSSSSRLWPSPASSPRLRRLQRR